MRTQGRVVVGQLWRSSDPRRLSAFRILGSRPSDNLVLVHPVYPPRGETRLLRHDAFRITGSKGYTLLEDLHDPA